MPDDEKTGAGAHSSSDLHGWREVAERASKEKDPYTLIKLVQELCDKIDESRGSSKKALDPDRISRKSEESVA